MTDKRQFDVIFKGALVDGADPGVVRENVATLFKADAGKLEKLFSGRRFVIKSNVDEQTAQKYVLAMRKAGAVCQVHARETGENASVAGEGKFTIAPPGVVMDETAPPAAPSIDTAALSMLDPGVDMEDDLEKRGGGAAPEPIDADIAPPGVILAEPRPVEAREIHIKGLSMAERGEDLMEAVRVEPVAIPDTSRYTLAPADQASQDENGPAASYLKSLGLD